jgi:hypothetical protein
MTVTNSDEFPGSLAASIRELADRARDGPSLRQGVESLLEPVLRGLGIEKRPCDQDGRLPVTVLHGRADALAGPVIIMYAPAGAFARAAEIDRTAAQLKKCLHTEIRCGRVAREPRGAVGVGLDGQRIFFVRYREHIESLDESVPWLPTPLLSPMSGHAEAPECTLLAGSFQTLRPYHVGEESIRELLFYLRALCRRPATAKVWSEEFGPRGALARNLVCTLYRSLQRAHSPCIRTLFEEWDVLFGMVYGQDLAKAERAAKELARAFGLPAGTRLKPLLFAVQTYYALIVKLLMAELVSLRRDAVTASPAQEAAALPSEALREWLADLEGGAFFNRLGVMNLVEGDFFGWYLLVWDPRLEAGIRALAHAVGALEPATGSFQSATHQDVLKSLYQSLVPRTLRHALGEYFAPGWLAELTLDEAGYDGNLGTRLLDPVCGSGIFLVTAIHRAREYADEQFTDPSETMRQILENIGGFDLNPAAVLTARANYLLALEALLHFQSTVEIPVYLCDSLLTPAAKPAAPAHSGLSHRVHFATGIFDVPLSLSAYGELPRLVALLRECVHQGSSSEEFLARAHEQHAHLDELAEPSLLALFDRVRELEREGSSEHWVHVLRNAFAPLVVGRFDYVVGNPPWANWASLADRCRVAIQPLLEEYGLVARARARRIALGKHKRPLSMLFTYSSADHYLRDDGKLAFVITQTVFKTRAGEVFRRFRLGHGQYLGVDRVSDLSELSPFEGAANRTSVLVLTKSRPTRYPVPYVVWTRAEPGAIGSEMRLATVRARTSRRELVAEPVTQSDRTSPWITATPAALSALRNARGASAYRAYAGVTTWANGIYWLHMRAQQPGGLLLVENRNDVGRLPIHQVHASIEPALVHPLVCGRDVTRWHCKPSLHIIVPHTPLTGWRAIPEADMRVSYPYSYAYLSQFRDRLLQRSGYRRLRRGQPFYVLGNVHAHLYGRYKVLWRGVTKSFGAAVLSSASIDAIPDHQLSFVTCRSSQEAHFLAAALNSAIGRGIVTAYAVGTEVSTHVPRYVRIPRFDPDNETHQRLSALSVRAHQLAACGQRSSSTLRAVEQEIDRQAAAMWDVSVPELATIQESLAESR